MVLLYADVECNIIISFVSLRVCIFNFSIVNHANRFDELSDEFK
jgi:hypothetical protein